MKMYCKRSIHFKRNIVLICLLIAFSSCGTRSKILADKNSISSGPVFPEGAQPKFISKQFSFTEGPASDKKGNVFFTDQPNNKIWEYDTNGKLSVFMDKAGRANGLYFDHKGNLIACADEHDQLWQISPKGKITVLVKDFDGKLLNGPNDLWVGPKGGIYISDPYYQRDYWTRKKPDLAAQNVYYLPKGKKELVLVADDLQKPNGLVGTPDGKYLFVTDIGAGKTYKYQIGADGKLFNRQLFVNQGSDGMTIDNRGDIYLVGNGVTVFNPAGKQIAHVDIAAKWTANICFGGKQNDELFITASEGFYVMKTNVKGVE